jgi:hypothetical protein
MKKPVVVAIVFVAIVLGVIIYSSMNLASHSVQVCMTFEGRTACRTASGSTEDFALRTAISNACAEISSGVTGTIGCERTTPTSVTWKK